MRAVLLLVFFAITTLAQFPQADPRQNCTQTWVRWRMIDGQPKPVTICGEAPVANELETYDICVGLNGCEVGNYDDSDALNVPTWQAPAQLYQRERPGKPRAQSPQRQTVLVTIIDYPATGIIRLQMDGQPMLALTEAMAERLLSDTQRPMNLALARQLDFALRLPQF